MTTISARTILKSRNASLPDKVLSSLLLRYPRWIHAEQRTHRLISLEEGLEFLDPTPSLMADPNLSRNAASSRAIPVEKMIQDVMNDPAVPLFWGKNQSGMQAREEMDENEIRVARNIWHSSLNEAVSFARCLSDQGLHKQIVNRILEPYSHITVLVSATEWDNFLELRDHPDAEPHIQMLAREIRKCLERKDDIQTLQPGEWHLPFVTQQDRQDAESRVMMMDIAPDIRNTMVTNLLIKKSVACCASTSYKTVDGFDMDFHRAIALHDKLLAARPIHASPAEHVARADHWLTVGNESWWSHPDLHGNFEGFCQYRHMIEQGNTEISDVEL